MDTQTVAGPPVSILVVEDDTMIGLVLKEMLEEIGFAVCGISTTENDAVLDAARFKPRVMIVDMQLAEGSGEGAMRRILAAGPMPCVFVSGAPAFVSKPDAAVLQKPFSERDLVRAIGHVIGPGTGLPAAA